eukprot:2404392-Alexandrium_andersonii.AAC.1
MAESPDALTCRIGRAEQHTQPRLAATTRIAKADEGESERLDDSTASFERRSILTRLNAQCNLSGAGDRA